ncbi:small-conductance mechanosensitive channel [Corynebacterium pseudotuberculosis]|uniref:mechanosensitive ion channel domain-containing protein n=1 Tax=Corynebacterium pseudotuberculosis TaxID=1719 RepID=UPI000737B68C|nr:mechanosensitive ion channel domain-containing protein [Corynebacterium pseudotuberculosis]ALU22106.1 small-conductance mechanosensitive channel [Corynebacterium pseudotuberculosis]ANH24449.1 Small-conductance mechanosensitive channel [Corynebacterium pseudotuberculosis]
MRTHFLLHQTWDWFINTGLDLLILALLAFLVPRLGRLAMRIVEKKVIDEHEDESKAHLAFAGVMIYIAQMIAYFVIFVFVLQQIGFTLAGAAIPATAASAAIGLGAQSIIADFLAGFFILSEKHYGVGDWVRFEGGATKIEGTVIQITMRATRIRTLAEETVIIPNSKAGVSINNSNYWSSAVVTMPIPLLGSASIEEAIERSTQATQRALHRSDIAPEILGELSVHPSVAVHQPSTVGQPWTVDMRFVCQVNPGSQWLVERAIRTSIIDEFWQEYGTAPTLIGSRADTLETSSPSAIADSLFRPAIITRPDDSQPVASNETTATFPHSTHNRENVEATQAFPAAFPIRSPEEAPTTELPDAQSPDRGNHAKEDPAIVETGLMDSAISNNENQEPTNQASQSRDTQSPSPSSGSAKTTWRRILTVGGRTRVSTTMLVVGFVLIVLFKVFTLEPDDAYQNSRSVAPPSPQPTAPVAPPAPSVVPTPKTTKPSIPQTTKQEPSSETPTPAQQDNATPSENASEEPASPTSPQTLPTGTIDPTPTAIPRADGGANDANANNSHVVTP